MKKQVETALKNGDEINEVSKKYFKYVVLKVTVITIFLIVAFIAISTDKKNISKIVPSFLPIIKDFSIIFIILSILYIMLINTNKIKTNEQDDSKKKTDKLRTLHKSYSIYDTISFAFICFYVMYLIIFFFLTPSVVSGESMNPNLKDKDRVVITQIYKNLNDGNIVVFDPKNYNTFDKEHAYIKRIAAKPFDIIRFDEEEGKVYINNKYCKNISESLKNRKYTYNNFETLISINGKTLLKDKQKEFKVPKNLYLLIGDNYTNSLDSTELGFINKKDILGKAIFRFWPINKIKTL